MVRKSASPQVTLGDLQANADGEDCTCEDGGGMVPMVCMPCPVKAHHMMMGVFHVISKYGWASGSSRVRPRSAF
jgi:hypothetical protein